jgi:crotonobetainyl-CoA:carnitine CoA-transferase CaiB-like acyl-CoA transferase
MSRQGLLAGTRVLDLTRVLAGPLATMLMADLGADVVKVERPGTGDDTREWGPPFVGGESAYYLAVNRGKRSVAIDWQHPDGRQLIRHLALDWADVVIDNARPGSLERYGLDPAALRAENPRLIWARIRGYPPGDDRPGYDFIVQAQSGLMSITGPVNGEPYKVGVAVSDVICGLYVANAVQAALIHRQATGEGTLVTVSLLEAQWAALINVAQSHLLTRQPARRWGNAHAQLVPYETLQAADGPLAVGVGNNRQFRALCEVLGVPELADDPRFRDNRDRVVHREALMPLLNARLATATRADWQPRLDAAGVPAGAVQTVAEAMAAAGAAGAVMTVVHPTVGNLAMVRPPIHIDDAPVGSEDPPPLLGEDTDTVLRELGYSADQVQAWRAAGVVG